MAYKTTSRTLSRLISCSLLLLAVITLYTCAAVLYLFSVGYVDVTTLVNVVFVILSVSGLP